MPLPGDPTAARPSPESKVTFGPFEFDPRSGELRKHGYKIKLPAQPGQILGALVEQPGELVTREDLRARLWPGVSAGDFEHGVNAAVNKLRQALGDAASEPRYIETVTGRGYRFVAPVQPVRGSVLELVPTPAPPDPNTLPTRRSAITSFPWIISAAATGAAAAGLGVWAWSRKSSPAPTQTTRFRLAPPEGAGLARHFTQQSLALSPEGRRLAMIAIGDRGPMVWVQRLDSLTANPLPGTEGATMVFWSPDGALMGFWAGGKIRKMPAEGGTSVPVCDLPGAWSATWNQDNLIVAQTAYLGPCAKISVQSGAVTAGRTLNWPKFLPGGKHLLYVNVDQKIKGMRAYVEELSTGRETELMPTDTHVTFTPDQPGRSLGHLLFGRNATLLALRFDSDRLQILGEPKPVAKDVPFCWGVGWSEFDTSSDGVLIHSTGSQEAPLTWLDRRGRDLGPVGLSRDFLGLFRLSPDGKKIAADVFDFSIGDAHVWMYDLSQNTIERLTREPGWDSAPVWSPDGKMIAYGGAQGGPLQLRVKGAGDQGDSKPFPPGGFHLPCDWSSDGRWIFYQTNGGEANAEIWIASVASRRVTPLLQRGFDTSFPALSPNGKLLAFSANDTGSSEIYVQRFLGGDPPKLDGDRRRVSRGGGNGARWRRDGKELFFLSPDRLVMAVTVQPETGVALRPPTALFRLPTGYHSLAPATVGYDVSSDGQKFLLPVRKTVGAPLQVVINWQAGLKT
jgi:Tol biopolymer transport system component/DNA-binding winged helix-turn-helix (wHTH) protein